MHQKPKALELADKLDHQVYRGSYDWERVEPMMMKAAAELRRLHTENDQLQKALRHVIRTYIIDDQNWNPEAKTEILIKCVMERVK